MLKEVFVSSTFWGDEGVAAESIGVIDFIQSALSAFSGGDIDCDIGGYIGDGVGD